MSETVFAPDGTVSGESGGQSSAKQSKISEYAYPHGPRPLQGFSSPLGVGLIIYAIAAFALVPLNLVGTLQPQLIDETLIESGELTALTFSMAALVVMAAFYLSFVFCIFLTGRFMYRAMRNLHTIGSKIADISPGWSVGWFFVPFANLMMPYRAMREIVEGSSVALGGSLGSESRLRFWWGFWLIGNIIGNGADRTVAISWLYFTLSAVSLVASGLAALTLRQIVRDVAKQQEAIQHGGVSDVFA